MGTPRFEWGRLLWNPQTKRSRDMVTGVAQYPHLDERKHVKSTAIVLVAGVLAAPASLILLWLTRQQIFFFLFLASLPVIAIYWSRLGRELRSADGVGPIAKSIGYLMGLPQALFGLLIAVGGAWVTWWLFNGTTPELSQEFLTSILVGLGLAAWGIGLIFSAFRRAIRQQSDAPQ